MENTEPEFQDKSLRKGQNSLTDTPTSSAQNVAVKSPRDVQLLSRKILSLLETKKEEDNTKKYDSLTAAEGGGDTISKVPEVDDEEYQWPDYESGEEGLLKARADIESIVRSFHQKKGDEIYTINIPASALQEKDGVARPGNLIPKAKSNIFPPLGPNHSLQTAVNSAPNLKPNYKKTTAWEEKVSLPSLAPTKHEESNKTPRNIENLISLENKKSLMDGESLLRELMNSAIQPSTEKEDMNESEAWKTDLNRASTLRLNGKVSEKSEESLTMVYKPPVWPHQLPLHRILIKIPKLTCLILDRSQIPCLRELGSSIPSLITLSISNCELKTLDGTFAFPNLRTLIASDNLITQPSQSSHLEKLQHLDLSGNPIENFEGFAHLSLCTCLRSLHLCGTRVSKLEGFQDQMKKYIPQLKELYPGGRHDTKEEEAADLEIFLRRNRLLIGSSYEENPKSKRKKKTEKSKKVGPEDNSAEIIIKAPVPIPSSSTNNFNDDCQSDQLERESNVGNLSSTPTDTASEYSVTPVF